MLERLGLLKSGTYPRQAQETLESGWNRQIASAKKPELSGRGNFLSPGDAGGALKTNETELVTALR